MILWLVFAILFGFPLYKSFKLRKKQWFTALIIVLSIGALDLALNDYMGSQTNCGKLYNPDIGCRNALPGWMVPLGFIAFAVSVLLSLFILIISSKKLIKHY